jgi:hypothetical protein
VPDAWVLFILFAIANPSFLNFWGMLFKKEGAAGTSIRIVYIFVGCVFAIAALILSFFD